MKLWLPNDILLKADKMTMASSLELRVPFLDKEVFKLLVTNKDTKEIAEILNISEAYIENLTQCVVRSTE